MLNGILTVRAVSALQAPPSVGLQWQNGHGGQQPPLLATRDAANAPVVTSAKTAMANATSFAFMSYPLVRRRLVDRHLTLVHVEPDFQVKRLDLEVECKVPYWFHGGTPKAAIRAGVSTATIRYYERVGFMPRPLCSTGGYRLYSERAVEELKFVRRAQGRLKKVDQLASLLVRLAPKEVAIAIAFLSGSPRQGRIGIGWAALGEARAARPASDASLELSDVDAVFDRVAATAGAGSIGARVRQLAALFERATKDEQDFLVRLLLGDLRQGALAGLLTDACARAAGVPPATMRRAVMAAGDLGVAAAAALAAGAAGLARFATELFRPLQPMLAQPAPDVADALATLGEAALELKVDGARVQVHKGGDEVRVYSRNLRDVTAAVPDVVALVRGVPAHELILDGEAIALRPDLRPHPFQMTMTRFGRKLNVDRLRTALPLTPFFFDLLYRDGASLIDEPQAQRFAALREVVPPALLIPHLVTGNADAAERFMAGALARGHEGSWRSR